ncbi:MAG TPA: GNAT family N-acetyltransferase [Microvirga sp.]|jgi:acetyltransferase|nr:GNAT family N-acetyltransferase [Microvirga sp.]
MTYEIHRYPAELIDVVRLRDGERITLRPILPQDAEIMQTFVQTLSDGSRRNRFFRTLRELPADLLRRFTQVDYRQHLALVAEVFTDAGEVIVGEGRYVMDEDGEGAEFAVAVADGWQGKGIGRLLLERLERQAAAAGVRRLHGGTLLDNRAMQRLARKAGFAARYDPQAPGVLLFEKTVAQQAVRSRMAALAGS